MLKKSIFLFSFCKDDWAFFSPTVVWIWIVFIRRLLLLFQLFWGNREMVILSPITNWAIHQWNKVFQLSAFDQLYNCCFLYSYYLIWTLFTKYQMITCCCRPVETISNNFWSFMWIFFPTLQENCQVDAFLL